MERSGGLHCSPPCDWRAAAIHSARSGLARPHPIRVIFRPAARLRSSFHSGSGKGIIRRRVGRPRRSGTWRRCAALTVGAQAMRMYVKEHTGRYAAANAAQSTGPDDPLTAATGPGDRLRGAHAAQVPARPQPGDPRPPEENVPYRHPPHGRHLPRTHALSRLPLLLATAAAAHRVCPVRQEPGAPRNTSRT